ncbi:multidrug resistance protein, putative [Talaromyces stipitatus ATCC 10500]|uniref:Multidrug resistance protein, putative n=1 Tax=Talaromyces stipitatus (strain ATCC 10500 / CBS 375.48 / QM 6759 / NRRL 1006) TaxID=441959 RepID=B8M8T9_TALSN|nr:multidrug resistance protein, putative [Talaromyces stipitatus ATCC 10500]EED20602.1 multidrug resistance protein, putative [Talaromyces stipitatus ATCC 10500]
MEVVLDHTRGHGPVPTAPPPEGSGGHPTNDVLKQGGWAALNSATVFFPPLLIRLILEHFESPDLITRSTAWLCVAGLLTVGMVSGIADCQCTWMGNRMTAKIRTILVNEIYEKVLRKGLATPHLSDQRSPKANATDGNILNLMSVDVEHVSSVSGNLFLLWVTFPIQIGLGTWLLYILLGISGIVGVLCMVLLLPLNFLISQRVMAAQARLLKVSDSRIQAGNELLHNIHTIKYSAWEAQFQNRVMEKRRAEMKELRSRFVWWSVNATTFHSLPLIVTTITCFFFTAIWGNRLKTSIAFPVLAIFSIIRIPLDRLATSITFLLQARVSLARIDNFLQERETDKYKQLSMVTDRSIEEDIGFDHATLSWPLEASTNTQGNKTDDGDGMALEELLSVRPFMLRDLNIRFQIGRLNLVCGPSGSGKSSILLALLCEMDLIEGQVVLPLVWREENSSAQTTAYCPQEPWIMNRSVRENITLNTPFDSLRYESVLHAVALLPDIANLDNGDQTFCGENGSRLSGGQKQRVALARALYSDCKIMLLDDCLNALDPHTAKHVFFHAIKGPLMKDRTCILVTHHTHLIIPHCDYVFLLENGTVQAEGFVDLDMTESDVPSVSELSLTNGKVPDVDESYPGDSANMVPQSEFLQESRDAETQLGHVERKAEGAVPWSIVKRHLSAMGSRWYWVAVLSLFVIQQIASLGTNLWIKNWALQYDNSEAQVNAWYYITIYVALCALYALVTALRDLTTFYGSLKASSTIFARLLNRVVHAKINFFDSVPLGQIINRFSKDMEVVDQLIAGFSTSGLQLLVSIAMVVVFISTVLPAFLIVAFFICVAYYFVMAMYINGARDLKRIEAVERSPLYQQFSETLAGFISIRAYARTSDFISHNLKLVDRLNQPYLLQWASKEWLTFRVNALSSFISFFTGAFVLLNSQWIEFGSAGLVLSYAVTFTENVMWLVQVYAIIQQNLNSVDRIFEYDQIEQEAYTPVRQTVYDMPEDWPSQGDIRLIEYTTRYSYNLKPVLKDISFHIRPGERVAVVGRTGAGKSSLLLALIRVLEADSGRIEIDGIDIAAVSLEQLRRAITIVPQNPKLFDGTLRDNLDPLNRATDEDIISALNMVHLIDNVGISEPVRGMDLLQHPANALSQGQRQLLCIARALLRRSHILILDEASASIDYATDTAIQAGLRASISKETSVLTVAHRLRTIADYDQVIVLDTGRIVEQGSVQALLARQGRSAIFRRMCEESGDLTHIMRVASERDLNIGGAQRVMI